MNCNSWWILKSSDSGLGHETSKKLIEGSTDNSTTSAPGSNSALSCNRTYYPTVPGASYYLQVWALLQFFLCLPPTKGLEIWATKWSSTLSSWIQVTRLLFKTHWVFPQILLFPPDFWVKRLPCLQFQPGLKPSLATSKQKWCLCHFNREFVCLVFQPGLW